MIELGQTGAERYGKTIDFDQTYVPYPVQAQFHGSPVKFKLLGGAAGPGKTLALIVEHLISCSEFADSRDAAQVHTLLLRRTHPKLEATLITRFREKIPRELYRSFNDSKKVVEWLNGSTTQFGSMQYEHNAYDWQGQWYKIGYDELGEFTFKQWMATSAWNRCPVSPYATKDGASNPIGVGAGWIESLFVKKVPCEEMDLSQRQAYKAEEYEYFPCTYLDNPVYANDPVFLANLEAYPAAERDALKYGKWGLAGGYFSGAWDPAICVYDPRQFDLKPWHTRWMSGDWGFDHWAANYWHCIDDKGIVRTYKEFVTRQQPPETLAESIYKESLELDESGSIYLPTFEGFYYSHDAFAKKTDQNSIAVRMEKVFHDKGMPAILNAGSDKVGREQLMYQMLRNKKQTGEYYDDDLGRSVPVEVPEWQISADCGRLISAIPQAPRDELKTEQIAQFPALDMIDGAGHGIYGRMGKASRKPMEVQRAELLAMQANNTQRHLADLRFQDRMKKANLPLTRAARWRRN